MAGTIAAIGNTSRAANRPLIAPGDGLLDREHRHRQRRLHAVLDLARVSELLHHRERDRLDALEHDRQPDDAGDEHGGESLAPPRPPIPWPIFGNTYANTNTSRNGWISVRGSTSFQVLRTTTRSRRRSARNAVRAPAAGLTDGHEWPSEAWTVTAVIRAGPFR